MALETSLARAWPGMDSREATRAPLGGPLSASGARLAAAERGGASDASHMAAGGIALTIDGLGPRGGGAHTPSEWVSAESLRTGPRWRWRWPGRFSTGFRDRHTE